MADFKNEGLQKAQPKPGKSLANELVWYMLLVTETEPHEFLEAVMLGGCQNDANMISTTPPYLENANESVENGFKEAAPR